MSTALQGLQGDSCGQWDELSVARVLPSAAGVQLTWLTRGETAQLLKTTNRGRQIWQGLQRDASCCCPQQEDLEVCFFFPSVMNVLRTVLGFLGCPGQGHELGSMITVGPSQLNILRYSFIRISFIFHILGCTVLGKRGWRMSMAVPTPSPALLPRLELKHNGFLLMNEGRKRGEDSSVPA